ncbi:MAG TPA: hypothetical protein PLN53_13615 [Terricaulis sp.]|nr:hypothetical protein [Terricaulis sp.]
MLITAALLMFLQTSTPTVFGEALSLSSGVDETCPTAPASRYYELRTASRDLAPIAPEHSRAEQEYRQLNARNMDFAASLLALNYFHSECFDQAEELYALVARSADERLRRDGEVGLQRTLAARARASR